MFEWIKRQFIIVCPFCAKSNPPLMRLLLKWERKGIGWKGIERRLAWAAIHGIPPLKGSNLEDTENLKQSSTKYARKEIADLTRKGLWTKPISTYHK